MKKQGKPKTTKNLPAKLTESTPRESTGPKGIDIADLIAYRAKGLSTTEIGKLTGCDHSNVSRRLAEAELDSLSNFKAKKDHVFEHLQRRTVKNITDAELKSLNPLQRITAAAILQDKIQVIRGQATEIVDHRVMVVNVNKAIAQLRAEQGKVDTIDTVEVDVVLPPTCKDM